MLVSVFVVFVSSCRDNHDVVDVVMSIVVVAVGVGVPGIVGCPCRIQ